MTEPQNQDRGDRPGKTRTWWHPLLARLMDHLLSTAYTVQEEVSIGILPLRVDILLIRQEDGQLPEAACRELSVLLPLLNKYTLLEFKTAIRLGPGGDAAQLSGKGLSPVRRSARRLRPRPLPRLPPRDVRRLFLQAALHLSLLPPETRPVDLDPRGRRRVCCPSRTGKSC